MIFRQEQINRNMVLKTERNVGEVHEDNDRNRGF